MPYVPCPPGLTISGGNTRFTSTWETKRPDGTILNTGSSLTSSVSMYGASKSAIATGKRRKLLTQMWAPCKAYTRSSWIIEYDPGTVVLAAGSPKGQVQTWSGYPNPSNVWSPQQGHLVSVPSDDFTVGSNGVPSMTAKTKARIDTGLLVKAGDRKINIGNNLGESRETLRMLCSSVTTLVRAWKAAKRGNFARVAKILKMPRTWAKKGSKFIAEGWLAYQYGWKPLVNDIYDSYTLLQEGLRTKPQLLHVARKIEGFEEKSSYYAPASKSYARSEAHMYGKMWFRIADSDLNRYSQLGLINPAEVAWEVLPFSFLVDWFVPVGSYLEALSARVGLTFVDGFYGIKVNTVSLFEGLDGSHSGYTKVSSTCSSSMHTSGYRRVVMTSLPWPDVWFKSPFSTIHVANALALLRTLWR